VKITWLGHACFLVEDALGTKVIADPFEVGPELLANHPVCHGGDFGQKALRPEQKEALEPVDILFLPVGGDPQTGRPTVDAAGARAVVAMLAPRLVIPMHYATPAVNFLQPVEPFLI